MAEISNLHRFNHHSRRQQTSSSRRNISNDKHRVHQEAERHEEFHQRNPFVLDFDCNNSNQSLFAPDDNIMTLNFGFDFNAEPLNQDSEYEDPNCFFSGAGEEDDDEQMNFVTDLFESRETLAAEDLLLNVDSGRTDDSGQEFGFGPGLGSVEVASSVGRRVVGVDSKSDSEEFEVSSSFINDDDDGNDSFGVSENEREEFEWEEVSERIHFDGRENLNALIEGIEEISVSLDTASSEAEILELGDWEGEVEERNIEWEVLLAMNNLESNFEFETPEEENVDGNEVPGLDIPDDYILTQENDTLFNQLVDYENALRGSPTAKSVVENLPSVVLTKEEVGENYSVIVCVVCSDEVAIGEKVTRMPCCHIYHGDCILPWLKIRNTCPVCRYELPTDDADYEKRRNERSGSGVPSSLVDDFQARYNF